MTIKSLVKQDKFEIKLLTKLKFLITKRCKSHQEPPMLKLTDAVMIFQEKMKNEHLRLVPEYKYLYSKCKNIGKHMDRCPCTFPIH